MSFNHVMFYVGCAAAWFILLPIVVIGGGIMLLTYALIAELGDSLVGVTYKPLDNSTAREMARRLCVGR